MEKEIDALERKAVFRLLLTYIGAGGAGLAAMLLLNHFLFRPTGDPLLPFSLAWMLPAFVLIQVAYRKGMRDGCARQGADPAPRDTASD